MQRTPPRATTSASTSLRFPFPFFFLFSSYKNHPNNKTNKNPHFFLMFKYTHLSTLSQAQNSTYAYTVGPNSAVPVANNSLPPLSHQILPRDLRFHPSCAPPIPIKRSPQLLTLQALSNEPLVPPQSATLITSESSHETDPRRLFPRPPPPPYVSSSLQNVPH